MKLSSAHTRPSWRRVAEASEFQHRDCDGGYEDRHRVPQARSEMVDGVVLSVVKPTGGKDSSAPVNFGRPDPTVEVYFEAEYRYGK